MALLARVLDFFGQTSTFVDMDLSKKILLFSIYYANISYCAGVAQLVELLICNQPVAGSSPVTSFFSHAYT